MFLKGNILTRQFYNRNTTDVAKELIGCYLTVLKKPLCRINTTNGHIVLEEKDIKGTAKIVETEAYLGFSDKACHSYKAKPSGRTNIMYNNGGYAYIYLVYGIHHCFNAVTREEGQPEAVLLRALEPLDINEDDRKYSGPGKLCKGLGITRLDYGVDLCAEVQSNIIIIKPDNFLPPMIKSAKRIGVAYSQEAAEYLYRFYDENSLSVSKK